MVAYADQAPLCGGAPDLTLPAAVPGSSCDQGVPSETSLLATTLWPKTYSVQKCARFVLMQRSANSSLYLPSLEGVWSGHSECQFNATSGAGQQSGDGFNGKFKGNRNRSGRRRRTGHWSPHAEARGTAEGLNETTVEAPKVDHMPRLRLTFVSRVVHVECAPHAL